MISRTLGIEGRKLLTPDDEFDPVKEFNEQFEPTESEPERLRLEYNDLVAGYPELAAKLSSFPLKVFSGKASPQPSTRAVFFCYRIPRPDSNLVEADSDRPQWSDAAGLAVWACYDLAGKRVLVEPGAIADLIRSEPHTPRFCSFDRVALSDLRKKVERHLTTEFRRALNAPDGIKPILKAWMEVS